MKNDTKTTVHDVLQNAHKGTSFKTMSKIYIAFSFFFSLVFVIATAVVAMLGETPFIYAKKKNNTFYKKY